MLWTLLFMLVATTFFSTSCSRTNEQRATSDVRPQAAPETTSPQKYTAYGDSVQSKIAPIALADAIGRANIDENVAQPVRIQAKVVEVCQKEGCWITLTDGKATMRVIFKDHGFFVPKDIAGKTVIAEGFVKADVLTEAKARHYAEDEGKTEAEISAIRGDQKQVSMTAQSVFVQTN
jgi:Domain of unknown function (DUF4920)